MQLKCIKISGFKSFADKIEIDVKDGITGIVGPNGSGKSNIVDAVKWVLGEQSVKALRGSKEMTDVIFQGSASRQGLRSASVTLVFDNSDHYLASDFPNLEIKRVVYASGENEYLLNNTKVRLKDITDLFLDSGAGKEAFSIISQGRIGEILNSKPEERRSIIEEAAGVLKYKKRKTESLKKLNATNENLSKIDLIIDELSVNLEPLREQSEKAQKYETYKNELESIEIALLVNDISSINEDYESSRNEAENIRNEISQMSSSSSTSDAKIEVMKLELMKVESEINKESHNLLCATEELSELEANKQLLVERKKYEVDDVKLESNILNLKEEIKTLEGNLSSLTRELSSIEEKAESLTEKRTNFEVDIKKLAASKSNVTAELALKNRLLTEYKNKLDILNSNIENDTLLPNSVKSVLSNPRLTGLHGTLGSILEIEEKYTTAIDTILGAMQNVIITDDEEAAKRAISYLKENRQGRATFFPLNLIKPRTIDSISLEKAKCDTGFIGTALDLVHYDPKYANVVANQLGNVIVAVNIDAMTRIGKLLNHTYRVVSLDGDIIHTGGSMSGGSVKNSKNLLTEKNNIANLNKEIEAITKTIENCKDKLAQIEGEDLIVNSNLGEIIKNLFELLEEKKNKESSISNLKILIANKKSELSGTEGIKNSSLDRELDLTLEKFYQKENDKNSIADKLSKLQSHKSELSTSIGELESESRKVNSEYNRKLADLNALEVKLGKLDTKLDTLLLRLSDEYDITYEKAKKECLVLEDINETRMQVQALRKKIKDLGEVNTGAISEFERINTRFE
ncbi:MAG TPA: hypothetical protein DCY94_04690, partial [Firmicutes bacterium]|nr:hypothetical protein [Bacillota bacterium]